MSRFYLVALLVVSLSSCNGTITSDDPSVDGGGGGVDGALSSEEPLALEGITALHNVERAKVGAPDLVWDPQLAAIAQAWVETCTNVDGTPGIIDHNPNRGDGYPGTVGENGFASGGAATPEAAVSSWVSEEVNYNYDSNTCNGTCGHYTQVVWAASLKIGCGVANCPGVTYPNSLFCDYSPAGNNGDRPY